MTKKFTSKAGVEYTLETEKQKNGRVRIDLYRDSDERNVFTHEVTEQLVRVTVNQVVTAMTEGVEING